jgi:hypothetical protein
MMDLCHVQGTTVVHSDHGSAPSDNLHSLCLDTAVVLVTRPVHGYINHNASQGQITRTAKRVCCVATKQVEDVMGYINTTYSTTTVQAAQCTTIDVIFGSRKSSSNNRTMAQ